MAHHGGRPVSMTSCTAHNSNFLQMKDDSILQILNFPQTPDLFLTTLRTVNEKKKEISPRLEGPMNSSWVYCCQYKNSIYNICIICWMECNAFSCPCYYWDHFTSSGNRKNCYWRLLLALMHCFIFGDLVKYVLHSMLNFCAF